MVCISFITPTTIAKIGSKIAEFIPVLGPTLDFTKKAKKMTEMTDPVSASSRRVGILFNYCFGKAGAVTIAAQYGASFAIECALWLGCPVVESVTFNPTLIAFGAQFGSLTSGLE